MLAKDYPKVAKVGDKIKATNGYRLCFPLNQGVICTVVGVEADGKIWVTSDISPNRESCRDCWFKAEKAEVEIINQSNTIMNIKERFVLALAPEPKKSFRKAGITNGDDLLTDDGKNIFLTYLLHSKYADEFKKDVVDGLLADQVKE